MVQKLMLLVLVGIFGCLLLIIAQNRRQKAESLRSAMANESEAAVEEVPSEPSAERTIKPRPSVQTVRRSIPITRPSNALARPISRSTPVPEAIPITSDRSIEPDQTTRTDASLSLVAGGSFGRGESGGTEGASITGKVTLLGRPRPEVPIDLGDICGKFHEGEKVTTRHFVVGSGGGLANVFVYIKEGAPKGGPLAEEPFLDQKGCFYEPYVLGAMAGRPIKIRNSDPLLHNVHATPKNNREFNFAQAVQGQTTERTFENPEVLVRVKCDIHPWMFAYIGVLDHPYYAVTDKDGSFRISNLPPGTYTIEAYHLKAGKVEKAINYDPNRPEAVNFELRAP